jgi:mono/diheme cytochrome c family protein
VHDIADGGRKPRPMLLAAALLATAAPAVAQEGGSDSEVGRQVFLELAAPACAICHTLAAAGASGTIAPNLDDLKPSEATVLSVVTEGVGVMPSYADKLTEAQISAVAEYVARVAGSK